MVAFCGIVAITPLCRNIAVAGTDITFTTLLGAYDVLNWERWTSARMTNVGNTIRDLFADLVFDRLFCA